VFIGCHAGRDEPSGAHIGPQIGPRTSVRETREPPRRYAVAAHGADLVHAMPHVVCSASRGWRFAGLAAGRRADLVSGTRGAHDAGQSRVANPRCRRARNRREAVVSGRRPGAAAGRPMRKSRARSLTLLLGSQCGAQRATSENAAGRTRSHVIRRTAWPFGLRPLGGRGLHADVDVDVARVEVSAADGADDTGVCVVAAWPVVQGHRLA
jgi:hypothetical protein